MLLSSAEANQSDKVKTKETDAEKIQVKVEPGPLLEEEKEEPADDTQGRDIEDQDDEYYEYDMNFINARDDNEKGDFKVESWDEPEKAETEQPKKKTSSWNKKRKRSAGGFGSKPRPAPKVKKRDHIREEVRRDA